MNFTFNTVKESCAGCITPEMCDEIVHTNTARLEHMVILLLTCILAYVVINVYLAWRERDDSG